MAIIQVTPELLREKAKELRNYRAEHDEVIQKSKALVNGLPDQFKGQAADSFIQKFNGMESTFKQFSEMLESFAVKLDNNANTLEETDKQLANSNNQ